jgi:hypothetical protein
VQLISNQSVSLIGTVITPGGQSYPNVLFEFIQVNRPEVLPNPDISPAIAVSP